MYAYDEKAAYERRCSTRRRVKHSSYDSRSSYSSSRISFSEEKFDDRAPPPYAHVFYNTIDDKPLPPVPVSQTRRVRFVLDKPLPPLPRDSDRPERKTSCDGEYAWWSKRFEMSDSEYDAFAREKETSE